MIKNLNKACWYYSPCCYSGEYVVSAFQTTNQKEKKPQSFGEIIDQSLVSSQEKEAFCKHMSTLRE